MISLPLLLLLPILVSVFTVCNYVLRFKLKIYRFENQYLYLKVIQLGVFCLILGSLLSICIYSALKFNISICSWQLNLNPVQIIQDGLSSLDNSSNSNDINLLSWIIFISVITMSIPFLWEIAWQILYRRIFPLKNIKLQITRSEKPDTDPKELQRAKIRSYVLGDILKDSPLDDLLFNAMIKKFPVMMTLEDRKVYLGYIITTGEPNESEGPDQEVSILPIMSGFRKSDTLEVEFTTDYSNFDNEVYMTIRQEKIISAGKTSDKIFDIQMPSKQNKKPAKPEEKTTSTPPKSGATKNTKRKS